LSDERITPLRTGAYGAVYRVFDTANNREVAVKYIAVAHARNPEAALEMVEREVRLMATVSHTNVIEYFGYIPGDTYRIIMEYASGGTLADKAGFLQATEAARYTQQILAGVGHLHSLRIVHRDLKGENILIGTDGILKVADLGASNDASEDGNTTLVGTPRFMAPELVRGNHTLAADIWSIGCCVIEMLTGEPPFKGLELPAIMYRLGSDDLNFDEQIPVLPVDVTDFIRKCCCRDPLQRPSCAELLQHCWISGAQRSHPGTVSVLLWVRVWVRKCGDHTVLLSAVLSDTFLSVKTRLEELTGRVPAAMKLTCRATGEEMRDEAVLVDHYAQHPLKFLSLR
jgi:serine/threonine protein kinase